MPNKQTLLDDWMHKEKEQMKASMPIPKDKLEALFEWLSRLNRQSCNYTLEETVAFLESRNLEIEKTIEWLRRYGGYCDCEVILNVKPKLES